MDTNIKEEYERELAERQRKHLENVKRFMSNSVPASGAWKPCLHDQCSQCHGTGINNVGQTCVHGIACNCPKCSPYAMATSGVSSISTYTGGKGCAD